MESIGLSPVFIKTKGIILKQDAVKPVMSSTIEDRKLLSDTPLDS